MHPARLAAALLVTAWAPAAHAWTDTQVTAVEAEIVHHGGRRATVALGIGLHVRGGWLSSFELGGLDSDLRLDPHKPPWLASVPQSPDQAPDKRIPEVRVRPDGLVTLSFGGRRTAPGRGRYRLHLVYDTRLARPGGPQQRSERLVWTLPPWRADLEHVRIGVTASRGARIAPLDAERDYALETEHRAAGSHEHLSWRRLQLPRTVPWSIAFEVPRREPAALAPPPPSAPRRRDSRAPPAALWLAPLLTAAALGKRLGRRRSRGSQPLLLPALRQRVRALFIVGLGSLATWLLAAGHDAGAWALLAGLVALAVDRAAPAALNPSGPGRWVHPGRYDLWRARRAEFYATWGGRAWLDATTALGGGLLLSVYTLGALLLAQPRSAGGGQHAWMVAAALLTPLALTGTRHTLRSAGGLLSLAELARCKRRLGGQAADWALWAWRRGDGQLSHPRLCLHAAGANSGLERLELHRLTEPTLVAIARDDSPADQVLQAHLPEARRIDHPDGRRAYLLELPRTRQARQLAELTRALTPDRPQATPGEPPSSQHRPAA